MPTLTVSHRYVGNAHELLTGGCDGIKVSVRIAEGIFTPRVTDPEIECVEVLPHLAADRFPNTSRVFSSGG